MSQFPIKAGKKISGSVPVFKDQGIDYVTAAAKAGEAVQHCSVTQSGASPYAVTFAGMGLKPMADATYDVLVCGPTAGTTVDYSTRTVTGFSITGGTAADRITVMVIGRLANQAK